ncbi:MAG: hypothetical protein WED05_03305 [Candidatus Atabeyarchaeum deiterrae]
MSEDIDDKSVLLAPSERKEEKDRYKMEVPIDGVPEEIEIDDIPIDEIELDEENPRIGYARDNYLSAGQTTNQKTLVYFLKQQNVDAYNRLKSSIEAGGGAVEMIWVMKKGEKYLCIDGNTRVIIYRELRDKYPRKEEYTKIKARILPEGTDERARNFIRLIAHLRAQNDWQAYERARMLYILWDKRGYSERRLMDTTKLSLVDIRRWIKAYKLMTEQFLPSYTGRDNPFTKFSYFVEYESKKIIDGMKKHELEDKDFCDWVGNGEIVRAQDVRDLKKMFDNKEIVKVLKEEGFSAAKEELSLSMPAYASRLFEHMNKCIEGLKSMSREEERSIVAGEEPKKKELILELYKQISSIAEMFKKFEVS